MNRMPDETKIKQAKWKIEEWKQNNKLIPQVHLLRFRSVKRKQTLKDQKKRPNFNFIENFCCFLFVVFLKWKLEKKKDFWKVFFYFIWKRKNETDWTIVLITSEWFLCFRLPMFSLFSSMLLRHLSVLLHEPQSNSIHWIYTDIHNIVYCIL